MSKFEIPEEIKSNLLALNFLGIFLYTCLK